MQMLDHLDKAFHSLISCLRAATAGVGPEFMLLPVGGFPNPVSIYGSDEAEFNRIKRTAIRLQREDEEGRIRLDSIILVWHRTAGEAAETVGWDLV